MSVLRHVLGAALLPCALAACVQLVHRVRRRGALALPLALAVLVVHEALLLTALSLFGWVTAAGVTLGHAPLLLGGAALAARRRGAGRPLGATLLPGIEARFTLALLPIAALVLASAIAYPPNSWDAMTYHLARVAHWIVNGSVLAYESWHPRQNTFPPGGAFLLLVPQVVADSDRLAPFVQLGAWGILAVATPGWARRFGAPRRLAAAAGVVFAAAPLAVLQASSAQYDLVSAAAALALAAAALPLRRPGRARAGDGALLGAALGAAWLVKSTAVIAAAPLVAWAGAAWLRRVLRRADRRALGPAAAALLVALAVVALELFRRRSASLASGFDLSLYAYPLAGAWGDRAANVVRSLAHHFPVGGLLAAVAPVLGPLSGRGLGPGPEPFRANESLAGSPLQAALFLLAVALVLARRQRVPPRAVLAVVTAASAWVLLHLLARDNAWISRLELPIFAVGVAALGALAPLAAPRGVAAAIALACVAHGSWAALRNEVRPPTLRIPDRLEARYAPAPQFRALDDAALRVAAQRGCTRIGSRLAEPDWIADPWDYPLVWRAHLAGIEVRHVMGTETWPCVLYTLTEPPRVRGGAAWRWSGDELVFVPAD